MGEASAAGGYTYTCWGNNGGGEIKPGGSTGTFLSPAPPFTEHRIKAIAFSSSHHCLLNDVGNLICWGSNSAKQLGDDDVDAAQVTTAALDAVAVAVGANATCLLNTKGEVHCFGSTGGRGGGTVPSPIPQKISLSAPATAVSGSPSELCALLETGHVACWGSGRLVPADLTLPDGTVVEDAVQIGTAAVPPYLSTVCARRANSEVYCRGLTGSDLPPFKSPGAEQIIDMAHGLLHVCVLDEPGQVYCAGSAATIGGLMVDSNTTFDTFQAIPGLDDVIDIEADDAATCARRRTGQVVCFGTAGHLGQGSGGKTDQVENVRGLP